MPIPGLYMRRNRILSKKTGNASFLFRLITMQHFLGILLRSHILGQSLQPTKTIYRVFLCSSYVGFVPVSDLLDMYCLIWRGVFLSKFLFVTDPNQNLVGEFSEAPDLPKHFRFWEIPKDLPKDCNAARVVQTWQCCWGCLIFKHI